MRRSRFGLILALLGMLLLAEQGATAHALSHVRYSGHALSPQVQGGDPLLDDGRCPACQAFAQVAHPATASAPPLIAPAANLPQASAPRYSIFNAPIPTPRSRGPPPAAI